MPIMCCCLIIDFNDMYECGIGIVNILIWVYHKI